MNKREPTDTLTVGLGERSYDIVIGKNLLQRAGGLMAPVLRGQKQIIITDENIAGHHLPALRAAMAAEGLSPEEIILPPGEHSKSFAEFEKLMGKILDFTPDRGVCLIALGGGVIGDLTGFAASTLLRGVDFIQIPTTLLAQVDSSVGGKTGINTPHGKNLIGTFYQPRLVIADTGALDTLPPRELLAGYAEIVKYGLLGDAEFFGWLEENGRDVIRGVSDARRHAVATSCRAKAEIVARDERESGDRALLNLGHTFGHALETETGFGSDLLHGEAVGIGMIMAFDLSVRMGLCPAEDAGRARNHLAEIGLPGSLHGLRGIDWQSERLMAHMAQDKKVRDGKITFILARGIGKAFVCGDVAVDDVAAILDDAMAA